MGQNSKWYVPNTNSTLTLGAGPVKGVSVTTTENKFVHSGVKMTVESGSHKVLSSMGLLSAVAQGGVLIGTPATICASAGGGVQIYAGAAVTPAIGGPDGPADPPFVNSGPAKVDAGKHADKMNKFNDVAKAAGDIAGGALGLKGAAGADSAGKALLGGAKSGYDMAKGAWDLSKVGGGEKGGTAEQKEQRAADDKAKGEAVGVLGLALDTAAAVTAGSTAEKVAGLVGVAAKAAGMASEHGDNLKKLKKANAAAAAKAALATLAGGPGAPSEGVNIVEIAPANIDRKAGENMTSLVGGEKSTKVDGKIESTSGASHSMKAFNKIETSSMFFEAFASIGATMKGLATAKVESLGVVTIDGKAFVKVESMVKVKVEAPKIDVGASTMWTLETPVTKIDSANVYIGKGKVKIESKTEITEQLKVLGSIVGKKSCHLDESLEVKGGACVHKNLQVKGKIKNPGFSASK